MAGNSNRDLGLLKFLTGRYQADSDIARHVESGDCDIVLSVDSDFSFLGGEKCLQICDFKLSKSKLSFFILKSGSCETIQLALHAANSLDHLKTKPTLQEPECAILDGILNPRIRCALAVILGSDTFPGGVAGLGPSKLALILDNFRKDSVSLSTISENDLFERLWGQ